MQEIQLHPSDLCFPRSLRAILIGPSQCGKSKYMMDMVRYKDRVFAKPYTKFIFCSPNYESALTSPRDEAYRQEMIALAEPAEMVFYDHIITEEELAEESEHGSQHLLCFIDRFLRPSFLPKCHYSTLLPTQLTPANRYSNWIASWHYIQISRWKKFRNDLEFS